MSTAPSVIITRVLANAGSGKTYKLSSEYLRVAYAGVVSGNPRCVESVLATTFTRAAARDIRKRVLLRAAEAVLDEAKRAELAESILGPNDQPSKLDPEQLLDALVGSLDRLEIRTIDSFLARIAAACSLELEIQPGANVIDDVLLAQLHAEAAARVIMADAEGMRALARLARRGKHRMMPLDQLMKKLPDLLAIWRDSQRGFAPSTDSDALPRSWIAPASVPLVDNKRAEAAMKALELLPVPETRFWLGAKKKYGEIWARMTLLGINYADVTLMLEGGPLAKLAKGALEFDREPIESPLLGHYQVLLEWGRAYLTHTALEASNAKARMLRLIDIEVAESLRSRGLCTFDSITQAVAQYLCGETLNDIMFRLDGKIDHLLLDEFQDTSLLQWSTMQPLAKSIASGGETSRSLLVVGDVKQSLYGWRGADRRLLEDFPTLLYEGGDAEVGDEKLTTSYRSSPVILAAVDAVFHSLESRDHPLRQTDHKNFRQTLIDAIEKWMTGYTDHVAAPRNEQLTGCVRLLEVPKKSKNGGVFEAAGRHAAELWHRCGGKCSIAVMTRKNKHVGLIAHAVRTCAQPAPCVVLAGGTLLSSAAVVAMLDLMRFAAHPTDTISLLSVMHSPLGEFLRGEATERGPTNAGAGIMKGWHPSWDQKECAAAALELRRLFARYSVATMLARWTSALESRPSGSPFDSGDLHRLARLQLEVGARETAGDSLESIVDSLTELRVQDVPTEVIHAVNIHQAKGLEWDIVIFVDGESQKSQLPELAVARGGKYSLDTADDVAPYMGAGLACEPVASALCSSQRFNYQGLLSELYVAITRARRGLWVVLAAADPPAAEEEGKKKPSKAAKTPVKEITRTLGGILRHALTTLPIAGHSTHPLNSESWVDDAGTASASTSSGEPQPTVAITPPMPGKPTHAKQMFRKARSPSQMSDLESTPDADIHATESEQDPLANSFGASNAAALLRGKIAHGVCESIEWSDEWQAAAPDLLLRAQLIAPLLATADLNSIIDDVVKQVRAPAIAAALARPISPSGVPPIAVRERTFLHIDESGALIRGAIDRLVLHGSPGCWDKIEVFDFKTDSPRTAGDDAWIKERVDHHRPQLRAYREAVAAEYQVSPSKISCTLLMLATGEVAPVSMV